MNKKVYCRSVSKTFFPRDAGNTALLFYYFSRMYQDKLAQLKKQLQQLRDSSHPEYNKKLKKIDATYRERYVLWVGFCVLYFGN